MLLFRRSQTWFALAGLVALTAAGCSNQAQIVESVKEGGLFSKPLTFSRPEWSLGADHKTAELGPTGPVAPEDLVNPDGSCAVSSQAPQVATPAEAAATAATAPVGSLAGDLAGAPAPAGAANEPAPAALGGIALGMSECETVRRAGAPGNVTIGTGEQGERKVVLTYPGGSWPGIYTFSAGRLKIVDAVPEPEKPKKPEKKKKAPKRAKTATQATTNRVNVQ